MSITDELRQWAIRHRSLFMVEEELNDIAVRIDAEYQKAIRELNNLADASVLLPVDADGVPIHVGDEVEGMNGQHANARFLVLHEDGVWDVGDRGWVPQLLHHVKPDSWEDIILDAVNVESLAHDVPQIIVDKLVERCRRLAGEAE